MNRLVAVFCVLAFACSAGDDVNLLPPGARDVRIGDTLSLDLAVDNPGGLTLEYSVEPLSALAGFDSVHALSGTPLGASFRWTPLISHVGEHELRFSVLRDGSVLDAETVVITVLPAANSAPSFVRPGAGATFDLALEPCVEVALEVRDADSAEVAIRARSPLPAGATLEPAGPKSADLRWCPSRDQIGASQRWIFEFEAEDESHAPVPHDFVAVLRAPIDESCEGEAPVVSVLAPTNGDRVMSDEVRARVTDDLGLRDAPLLYWTTEAPDDPSAPDVTTFEQVALRPADTADEYLGRIGLALEDGEERTVFLLVSATDNDDRAGALCDNRTDGELLSIVLVGAPIVPETLACEPCAASSECVDGVCSPGPGGGVCLPSCEACDTGTCGMFATLEGPLAEACGDADAACSPPPECEDDADEPNDSLETATLVGEEERTGLAICEAAGDFFRIDAGFAEQITAIIEFDPESDLDMRLLDGEGTIVDSSAGIEGDESVTFCARGDEPLIAHVFGYEGATGEYDLTVFREVDACCADDGFEPDDTATTARPDGADLEGIICAGDDDVYAIVADEPSTLTIELTHDVGDIDIQLLSPAGTVIAVSEEVSMPERIEADVTGGGRYLLRVYGFRDGASPYRGSITREARTACEETLECAPGDVCDGGACRSGSCTSDAMCPDEHRCASSGVCAPACRVNADCRSSEACKWSFVGRACIRRGEGRNGDACVSAEDCGAQRECTFSELGGMCGRALCTRNADCETGTYCVGDEGSRVCAPSCVPGECRTDDGFGCGIETTADGTSESVCRPS